MKRTFWVPDTLWVAIVLGTSWLVALRRRRHRRRWFRRRCTPIERDVRCGLQRTRKSSVRLRRVTQAYRRAPPAKPPAPVGVCAGVPPAMMVPSTMATHRVSGTQNVRFMIPPISHRWRSLTRASISKRPRRGMIQQTAHRRVLAPKRDPRPLTFMHFYLRLVGKRRGIGMAVINPTDRAETR